MSDFKINRVPFSSNNNDNVVPFVSKEEINGFPIWVKKNSDGTFSCFEENGNAIRFK